MRKCGVVLAYAFIAVAFASLSFSQAQSNAKKHPNVPSELQATDPEIRSLIESARDDGDMGLFDSAIKKRQQALDLSRQKGSLQDRIVAQTLMASTRFVTGHLDESKALFESALEDAIQASNLVAQADVLVALSSFSEAAGDKDQTLAMLGRALTLARQSKSLYIQARVLGELGRVQLAKGNTAASRSSLQEALQLDRLNEYDLEAGHRVYFSHVHLAESNTHYEEVIPELRENLEFAIQKESTIAILQAGLTLEAVS